MSIILYAMRTILNKKQREGESLQDHTKRFCVAQDVLQSLPPWGTYNPNQVCRSRGWVQQDGYQAAR